MWLMTAVQYFSVFPASRAIRKLKSERSETTVMETRLHTHTVLSSLLYACRTCKDDRPSEVRGASVHAPAVRSDPAARGPSRGPRCVRCATVQHTHTTHSMVAVTGLTAGLPPTRTPRYMLYIVDYGTCTQYGIERNSLRAFFFVRCSAFGEFRLHVSLHASGFNGRGKL